MSLETDLQKDGIIVQEKIADNIKINLINTVSEKIVSTFTNFKLDKQEILSKLSNLNMYKAQMPEQMAEANYCYRNSSIYFNNHIPDEDLWEFAIHECLHFLQEVKNDSGKIVRMGLCNYSSIKTQGLALNEAAVQYIASKIIGINPDFEKYYDINIYTPSPSYYPIECALLNEIIYFTGEDILFESTYFSNDNFKNMITNLSSEKVFNKIQNSFDQILQTEEKIILLSNKLDNTDNTQIAGKINQKILNYRKKINNIFIDTQNLIITEFFNNSYKQIDNLEKLENYRRKLYKFKAYIGTVNNYTFFDNYYIETMNKLEHLCNILENGGIETALEKNTSNIFIKLFKNIKSLLFSNFNNANKTRM